MGNLSNWGRPRLRGDSSKSGGSQLAMGLRSLAFVSPSFPCIPLCWAGVAAYPLDSSTRDNLKWVHLATPQLLTFHFEKVSLRFPE